MGIWGIRMRKEVWDRVGAHLLSEPGVLLHLLAHPRLLTVRLCVHHLQRVEGARGEGTGGVHERCRGCRGCRGGAIKARKRDGHGETRRSGMGRGV